MELLMCALSVPSDSAVQCIFKNTCIFLQAAIFQTFLSFSSSLAAEKYPKERLHNNISLPILLAEHALDRHSLLSGTQSVEASRNGND